MKGIRFLLAVVIYMTSVCVFGQTREEARQYVISQVNKSKKYLPSTESGITITNIEVKGFGYITYIEVGDNQISYNSFISALKARKEDFFLEMTTSDRVFAKNLVIAGLNLALVVKDKRSNKQEIVAMMANEYKDALFKMIKESK